MDGLVLLHKDKEIRLKPLERVAFIDCKARSFALSNGQLTGAEGSRRILAQMSKILRVLRKQPGPFFYLIFEDHLEPRPLDR